MPPSLRERQKISGLCVRFRFLRSSKGLPQRRRHPRPRAIPPALARLAIHRADARLTELPLLNIPERPASAEDPRIGKPINPVRISESFGGGQRLRYLFVTLHFSARRTLWEARQNLPVERKWRFELIFDFQCGEKSQMYPLRYIEDFSPC